MSTKLMIRLTVTCIAFLMAFTPINASAAVVKRGDKGSEVKQIQTSLKELGYYTYSKTTGYYGSITVAAVKRFQKANGLYADGVVGKKTKSTLLASSKATEKKSEISLMSMSAKTVSDNIGDLDWFKEVRYIWDRGINAVITDVETGKSFEVRRTYGTNHADVEPLTKEDTATIKKIWGGFSWERRAVVVQIGDYTIAASMTAMPHAGVDSATAGKYVSNRSGGYGRGVNLDSVKNNGCNGVMDIHFKNSRTHTTNVVQSSMQNMVEKAAEYIWSNY
ncbi:MAG: peptidoglycan-binding protein [Mobilitalea sp.]